jgi:hypothetical protein
MKILLRVVAKSGFFFFFFLFFVFLLSIGEHGFFHELEAKSIGNGGDFSP